MFRQFAYSCRVIKYLLIQKKMVAPMSRYSTHRTSHKRFTTGAGRVQGKRVRPMGRALSKVRNQRPTAKAQQYQIMRNTLELSKIWNRRYQKRVYTDWQNAAYLTGIAANTWSAIRLTDFSNWSSVMRVNTNVDTSSHTFCKRMQLSVTYDLGTFDSTCYFNIFLIRTRWPNATYDPTDTTTPMTQGVEYVSNPSDSNTFVRLNAGMFKVIKSKHHALTYLPVKSGAAPTTLDIGNPQTTHGRLIWDIPLKMKITDPSVGSWKGKAFSSLPYYDKLFLMVIVGNRNAAATSHVGFNYDAVFTCVNTD